MATPWRGAARFQTPVTSSALPEWAAGLSTSNQRSFSSAGPDSGSLGELRRLQEQLNHLIWERLRVGEESGRLLDQACGGAGPRTLCPHSGAPDSDGGVGCATPVYSNPSPPPQRSGADPGRLVRPQDGPQSAERTQREVRSEPGRHESQSCGGAVPRTSRSGGGSRGYAGSGVCSRQTPREGSGQEPGATQRLMWLDGTALRGQLFFPPRRRSSWLEDDAVAGSSTGDSSEDECAAAVPETRGRHVRRRARARRRPPPELKATFEGDPAELSTFIFHARNHARRYGGDDCDPEDLVAAVISSLQGKAGQWAMLLVDRRDPALANLEDFLAALRERFQDPQAEEKAKRRVQKARQGDSPVQDYVDRFRGEAAQISSWNEEVLIHYFKEGLHPELRKWAVVKGTPRELSTLDGWCRMVAQLEADLGMLELGPRAGKDRRPAENSGTPRPANGTGAPRPKRTPDPERERRRRDGLCMRCGGAGHYAAACPQRPPGEVRTLAGSQATSGTSRTPKTGSRAAVASEPREKRQSDYEGSESGNDLDLQ